MLLEELLVKELRTRKNKLFINIKHLGEFYFPFWMHKFPSKIFGIKGSGKKEVLDLEEKLKKEPELSRFNRKIFSTHFDTIVQEAPISYSKLMKQFGFVTGHYAELARWYFLKPGDIIDVDERIFEISDLRSVLNEAIKEYYENLHDYAVRSLQETEKEYSESYRKSIKTELVNLIERKFQDYDGSDFYAVVDSIRKIKKRIIKKADIEILEKRKKISEMVFGLNQHLREINENCYAELNINNKEQCADINLDSTDYFKKKESVTLDELRKERWVFLDIEKPLFRKTDSQISWYSMLVIEGGRIIDKICLTTHDIKGEVDGFRIVKAKDEKDLIAKAADTAKKCFIISAYNAPYDLEESRNVEKDIYLIGERRSEPKVIVSLPFFRRDDVRGKFVIDPLRWARTAFSYLPNQKMEMIAKHLFGDENFSKMIDYDEMEDLETIALYRDFSNVRKKTRKKIIKFLKQKRPDKYKGVSESNIDEIDGIQKICSEIIASYVNKDVSELAKILQSEQFIKNFEDYAWIGNHFNVETIRLMHSTNAINDRQEHIYFDALGVLRDMIYLPTKDMQRRDSAAKQKFNQEVLNFIEEDSKRGMYEKVYKVFLPIGDYLRNIICVNFEDAKEFFEYKYQFLDDHQRQFFLSKFSNALANLIIIDYKIAKQERKRFEDMISEKVLGLDKKEIKKRKINKEIQEEIIEKTNDFANIFDLFASTLDRWGKTKLCDDINLSLTRTKDYLSRDLEFLVEKRILWREKVDELKRVQKTVNEWIDENLSDEREFWLLINQYACAVDKENKVVGNYSNFRKQPKDIVDLSRIEQTLKRKIDLVNSFIRANEGKIKLVYKQGHYLYFTGDKDVLENSKRFILVDEIDNAIVAEDKNSSKKSKIYYEKHGFIEGLKGINETEPTYSMTIFESRLYSKMFRYLFDKNIPMALSHLEKMINELRKENIEKEELVWKSKSTGIYRAFEKGKKQKIMFLDLAVDDLLYDKTQDKYYLLKRIKIGRKEEERKVYIETEEEIGRKYFDELYVKTSLNKNTDKRKKSVKTRRRYIMSPCDFNPDYDKYLKQVGKAAKKIKESLTKANDYIKTISPEDIPKTFAEMISKMFEDLEKGRIYEDGSKF